MARELKLDPAQKRTIREIVDRRREEALKLSRELEDQIVDAFTEACDADSAERLRAVLGSRPKDLPGCPSLLLARSHGVVLDPATLGIVDDKEPRDSGDKTRDIP